MSSEAVLVTGGAGFIGSNFVLDWIDLGLGPVVNLDKLTYAGNLTNLASLQGHPLHHFVHGDIADLELVAAQLGRHQPRAIVHFAAESHVDRSIHGPEDFVATNVLGTFRLLEAVRSYWAALSAAGKAKFRFVHISTDEVFGSLQPRDSAFSEESRYEPNSPYAASKASADHLVRAYHHTYGLPAVTVNCSNNYGPYQFPEKLIPLMILNALEGKPLPVYGDGLNVRDWLYVKDHCAAIRLVLERGAVGQTYNVGGNSERANLEVVKLACSIIDDLKPRAAGKSRQSLIAFVKDRPGHDRRYAIDSSKARRELGWAPSVSFEEGLLRTVRWYLENPAWVEGVRTGGYREWLELNYVSR